MITKRQVLLAGVAAFGAGSIAKLVPGLASAGAADAGARTAALQGGGFPVVKTEAEWRRMLEPEQYRILREQGTEPAGSSPLNHEERAGTFHCVGCAHPLFASEAKYDSGTGWPSFFEPLPKAVGIAEDRKWFILRTEVHCARCGGHLGHVFEDGPEPTGLRYCMNGVALDFTPA